MPSAAWQACHRELLEAHYQRLLRLDEVWEREWREYDSACALQLAWRAHRERRRREQ